MKPLIFESDFPLHLSLRSVKAAMENQVPEIAERIVLRGVTVLKEDLVYKAKGKKKNFERWNKNDKVAKVPCSRKVCCGLTLGPGSRSSTVFCWPL